METLELTEIFEKLLLLGDKQELVKEFKKSAAVAVGLVILTTRSKLLEYTEKPLYLINTIFQLSLSNLNLGPCREKDYGSVVWAFPTQGRVDFRHTGGVIQS